MAKQDGKKKAIALAGGGPAAGLQIGVLAALEEKKGEDYFDVWALSCIGAWVGIIYNQFDKGEQAEKTEKFFREHIFRDDDSYSGFPINSVFGPDLKGNLEAFRKFLFNPRTYFNAWGLPKKITDSALKGNWEPFNNFVLDPNTYFNTWGLPNKMVDATRDVFSFLSNPNEGDFNHLFLELSAKNPVLRFYMSMMFLSEINGLTKMYYPDGSFLKSINFDEINRPDKPFIYHNAWDLTAKKLRQFANQHEQINNQLDLKHDRQYKPLTARSLCACSALPFIEQTVEIEGHQYCEGALIDAVNLKRLLDDHGDSLAEIWICRIVDDKQVEPPRNLHDALGNLCQLFAATVGEDDVKLFEDSVRQARKDKGWSGDVFEIEVKSDINFDWTHSNLEHAIKLGREAVANIEKCKWDIKALMAGRRPTSFER